MCDVTICQLIGSSHSSFSDDIRLRGTWHSRRPIRTVYHMHDVDICPRKFRIIDKIMTWRYAAFVSYWFHSWPLIIGRRRHGFLNEMSLTHAVYVLIGAFLIVDGECRYRRSTRARRRRSMRGRHGHFRLTQEICLTGHRIAFRFLL